MGMKMGKALAAAVVSDGWVERDEAEEEVDNRILAQGVARIEVADAVAAAMSEFEGSLREFQRISGVDPAIISRLMNQRHKQGGTVATLAQIAVGLGKSLKISIE